MAVSTSASTLEYLIHLASKPGVQSTLILSKSDGSIIRSSGLLSSIPSSASVNLTTTDESGDIATIEATRNEGKYGMGINENSNTKHVEDIARMVFAFVSSAEGFVDSMDESDDLKLLRLRTRKNEIVIVPDSQFLLVVIQDSPKP